MNIALANEFKVVFERMGIDVWEALDAASTKPFGFMRFNPGPGPGGHCIPVDPVYLTWKARELGLAPRLIELAGVINAEMPRYVVDKLQEGLKTRQKSLEGGKILLLGVAYKKDIDDVRESPAFELMRLLLARGAEVSYHDAQVPALPRESSRPGLPALVSRALTPDVLQALDAVVICTDHSGVDYALVARFAPLVVDTRGVYRSPLANVIKA